MKIISIADEELFSETYRNVNRFILCLNYMIFQLVLYSPSFEAVYYYMCSRRRVAVARYRMICLVHVLAYFHDGNRHSTAAKNQYIALNEMGEGADYKTNGTRI